MSGKERYFEAVDKPAPPFELVDAWGRSVSLRTLSDKVVVLQFIYASCPGMCPLHAEKLAEAQRMINASPMKELVQFISITTDPENDAADIRRQYGPDHGLDPANWRFLTIAPGRDEGATRALADAYNHRFVKSGDGLQTHGVVTHVIDKDGRWAGNFHGLEFKALNLVLYVNGLINNEHRPHQAASEKNWWTKFKNIFW